MAWHRDLHNVRNLHNLRKQDFVPTKYFPLCFKKERERKKKISKIVKNPRRKDGFFSIYI